MGIAMIITQAVIARKPVEGHEAPPYRLRHHPGRDRSSGLRPLMRSSLPGASCGNGHGMALPGYNAGPTLKMSVEEQGAVAGVINANNSLAYAIAPLASAALYGWNPLAPFIISIILTAAITVFVSSTPSCADEQP